MKRIQLLTIYFSILVLAACTSAPPPMDSNGKQMTVGSTVYTLTNLRPDTNKKVLYTANYQQPGFIPRCTAIKIVDSNKKRLTFSIKDVVYSYNFHPRSTPEGFEANIQKYFGSKCNKSAISKLSSIDQKGIKNGKAYIGMSKQGIIYAIGYPPESATPSTEGSTWKYWVNRFNTTDIQFDSSGKVSAIKN